MSNKKSVFISYSSKDEVFVGRIVRMLEKLKISYWKAPEMIPAGSSYAREIPSAIRECQIFLLLISKAAQESIWVEKEIDNAVNCRKTIVPIQIDQTPFNDMFRFYLNNVQTIFYSKEGEQAFLTLEQRLLVLLKSGRQKEEQIIQQAAAAAKKVTFSDNQKPEPVLLSDSKYVQKYAKYVEAAKYSNGIVKNKEVKAVEEVKNPAEEAKKGLDREKPPYVKAQEEISIEPVYPAVDENVVLPSALVSKQESKRSSGNNTNGREEDGRAKASAKNAAKRKTDALQINPPPAKCHYCGGELKKISRGTFQCNTCGKENYDYFQTVRNYLDRTGATSVAVIQRDTGVPRRVIEHFLRQEYLEVPKYSAVKLVCEDCGTLIRTGYLCDSCKRRRMREPESVMKGSWHSTRRK